LTISMRNGGTPIQSTSSSRADSICTSIAAGAPKASRRSQRGRCCLVGSRPTDPCLGEAGPGVETYGVPTDNQVVNLVSGEDRQQIFEVRVEWHVPSLFRLRRPSRGWPQVSRCTGSAPESEIHCHGVGFGGYSKGPSLPALPSFFFRGPMPQAYHGSTPTEEVPRHGKASRERPVCGAYRSTVPAAGFREESTKRPAASTVD